MSSIFKYVPLLLAPLSAPLIAQEDPANDPAGFLIGGGVFTAVNADCTQCEYSGGYGEIGYDFNEIVGIEAKFASGDGDDDYEVKVSYLGFNIGHDFNTDWFRFYGKVGYGKIDESIESYQYYCDYYNCYSRESELEYSDNGVMAGLGVRFTLSGKASGLYLKLESSVVSVQNDSASVAFMGGLGYRF